MKNCFLNICIWWIFSKISFQTISQFYFKQSFILIISLFFWHKLIGELFPSTRSLVLFLPPSRFFFLPETLTSNLKAEEAEEVKYSKEEHFASSAAFTSFSVLSLVRVSVLLWKKQTCGEWGNRVNWFYAFFVCVCFSSQCRSMYQVDIIINLWSYEAL